ncbi:hypothetical protein OHB39_29160 [Streptomyces sp. NBC_00047]|uniref:hypothetical protein n=1 Tax=Streptomyces sp. NBC_00047 TaxID=2975627 RepID=UPI00225279D2|nr:hypothetical protein [Streptomyces sp. NBC_00047]MCX5611594.1 hypothetical protein [Streptomyces sp. NBC_00047]
MTERRLARLPVQVAPRLGEETDSFIRRLARANHLKPSYLHGYLCGPPFWFGKPQLGRLADATGRSPHALERALSDASSPRGRVKPSPRYPGKDPFPGRSELCFLISDDARDGTMTIRALAERYQVPRWTVRLVLDTARPVARDVKFRKDPVMVPVIRLVDGMLARGVRGRAIWAELMDEHDYSVSYSSLLYYVHRGRHIKRGRQP